MLQIDFQVLNCEELRVERKKRAFEAFDCGCGLYLCVGLIASMLQLFFFIFSLLFAFDNDSWFNRLFGLYSCSKHWSKWYLSFVDKNVNGITSIYSRYCAWYTLLSKPLYHYLDLPFWSSKKKLQTLSGVPLKLYTSSSIIIWSSSLIFL